MPFTHNNPSLEVEEDLVEGDQPLDEDEVVTPPAALMKSTARQKDTDLYHVWRKEPSKENMTTLVNHLGPLIYSEVKRAVGTLPTSALMAEGKINAIKAIKTFDPDRGVALSTHIVSRLPKVRRMNYKFQNAARMPEDMKREVNPYQRTLQTLSDEYNREPTEDEIAKHLGWSKGKVVRLKSYLYEDLIESAETKASETKTFSDDNILMEEIRRRLTPQELLIWDNKGTVSAPELARIAGFKDVNGLNYAQRKLVAKLEALKREVGL